MVSLNRSIGLLKQFSCKFSKPKVELSLLQDYAKHGITIETGFHSLAVIYGVLGMSNWFAPAIVNKLGQLSNFTFTFTLFLVLFVVVN